MLRQLLEKTTANWTATVRTYLNGLDFEFSLILAVCGTTVKVIVGLF